MTTDEPDQPTPDASQPETLQRGVVSDFATQYGADVAALATAAGAKVLHGKLTAPKDPPPPPPPASPDDLLPDK